MNHYEIDVVIHVHADNEDEAWEKAHRALRDHLPPDIGFSELEECVTMIEDGT